MNELFDAHKKALIDNGVPPELAADASLITANESLENPRTQEQQKIITEAWHYMNRHWEDEAHSSGITQD